MQKHSCWQAFSWNPQNIVTQDPGAKINGLNFKNDFSIKSLYWTSIVSTSTVFLYQRGAVTLTCQWCVNEPEDPCFFKCSLLDDGITYQLKNGDNNLLSFDIPLSEPSYVLIIDSPVHHFLFL